MAHTRPALAPPLQSQFLGETGVRVRRWARVLERSGAAGGARSTTWQEILRRYCLLSRHSVQGEG